MFACGAALLALLFWSGLSGLPPYGGYLGPYGDLVNTVSVEERQITDSVSAVTFDIRGFDTLGEEYILFTCVAAVLLILRQERTDSVKHHHDRRGGRGVPPTSPALKVVTCAVVPLSVVFGIYIATHGQVSPGGGFQGGVILATAPLFLYLSGGFSSFRRATPTRLLEISEAVGAGGFALIGAAALFAGAAFLGNFLPHGTKATVVSGGTVPLISLSVALEVSGGLTLILQVFLEELLEFKRL